MNYILPTFLLGTQLPYLGIGMLGLKVCITGHPHFAPPLKPPLLPENGAFP